MISYYRCQKIRVRTILPATGISKRNETLKSATRIKSKQLYITQVSTVMLRTLQHHSQIMEQMHVRYVFALRDVRT